MFSRFRQRLADMKTIKDLLLEAEQLARADGQAMPAAEHVVLSACALPDGSARRALAHLGATPEQFRAAVAQQYRDALEHVGIALPEEHALADAGRPLPGAMRIYRTKPSAEALMHTLIHDIIEPQRPNPPLRSAHVLMAACEARFGVVARALRVMRIEPAALAAAAREEVALPAAASA